MTNEQFLKGVREDGTVDGYPVETYYRPCDGIGNDDGFLRVQIDDGATDIETRIPHSALIAAGWYRAALASQAQPTEAELVCFEAYQVVGLLLSDLGKFDTPEAEKILDNLSQAKLVHKDVLPWESYVPLAAGQPHSFHLTERSGEAATEREVPSFTVENPCACGAYGGPESHAQWCKYAAGVPACEPLKTHCARCNNNNDRCPSGVPPSHGGQQ